MNSKIMFAGSFDPFHQGHQELVEKVLRLFDQVLIVVSRNPEKHYQLSASERADFIVDLYADNPRIKVLINENMLTADFAKLHQVNYLLRGFRNDLDFSYEAKIAQFNKAVNPQLEMIYFFSEKADQETSSSHLKEINKYKKDYHYE